MASQPSDTDDFLADPLRTPRGIRNAFFLNFAILGLIGMGYFALQIADATFAEQDRIAAEHFNAAPRGISMAEAR